MPTRHLIGCVFAVIGLASVLTLIAPSAGGFAIFAAFLLCPLVMVIAMRFIMGAPGENGSRSGPIDSSTHSSTHLTERVGR